jgi:hypothetical protein
VIVALDPSGTQPTLAQAAFTTAISMRAAAPIAEALYVMLSIRFADNSKSMKRHDWFSWRWIYGLMLHLLVLSTPASSASCEGSPDSQSDTYYFPIVVAESNSIVNPLETVSSEERGHKYGSAWARRTLSVKLSRDTLRRFFNKQLVAQGWESSTKLIRRSTNGFAEIDYYCKGETEAELAFERVLPSSPNATSMKLSIYWSSGDDGACLR